MFQKVRIYVYKHMESKKIKKEKKTPTSLLLLTSAKVVTTKAQIVYHMSFYITIEKGGALH